MKLLLMVMGLLLIVSTSLADDLCSFKGIKFGTDRQIALEEIKKEYENPFEHEGSILVSGYKVGDKETDNLMLYFDENGKFYSFRINFPQYAANRIDDTVVEDLFFISSVFEKKYKKPSKTLKLNTSKVLFSEHSHHFKEWKNKKCTGSTGVVHYDSQFYAFGDVTDNKLSNQQYVRDGKKYIESTEKGKDDI